MNSTDDLYTDPFEDDGRQFDEYLALFAVACDPDNFEVLASFVTTDEPEPTRTDLEPLTVDDFEACIQDLLDSGFLTQLETDDGSPTYQLTPLGADITSYIGQVVGKKFEADTGVWGNLDESTERAVDY